MATLIICDVCKTQLKRVLSDSRIISYSAGIGEIELNIYAYAKNGTPIDLCQECVYIHIKEGKVE